MVLGAGAATSAAVALAACSGGDDPAGSEASAGASSSTPTPSGTGTARPGIDLPQAFTPVLISTIGAETAPVQTSDGRWRVLYELLLTNSKSAPAELERIDVVDARETDRVVGSYEGEKLLENLRLLSGPPAEEPEIPPDASRLLLLDLVFDSRDDVPDAIAQRFVGLAADNPAATEPAPVDYLAAPFTLGERTQATIAPPLRGAGWFAVNGLDTSTGVHRGSVQSVSGQLFDAQRFAIDWMKLDDDDTLASGDGSRVEDFHCYDEPVHAVADATVVSVVTGLPDQEPGELPDPASITLETVDGNHVVLELADGVHAFYAHLRDGSIEVAEGDTVSAGDVIGRLGNSGNTSAPHLHLHLMTTPRALAADSIPYVFDAFTLLGRIGEEAWATTESIVGPWTIENAQETSMTERLPLGLTVVGFREG